MLKRASIIFSYLILFCSCSIQKKHYLSGYHIEWQKKSVAHRQIPPDIIISQPLVAAKQLPDLSASLTKFYPKKEYKLSALPITAKENCDTIVLNSGEIILARVLEVTPEEVKFRYCLVRNRSTWFFKREHVTGINYSDGDKDYFTPQTEEEKVYENKLAKASNKSRDLGELSILFMFLLVTIPLGLILAFKAHKKGNTALKMIGSNHNLDMRYSDNAISGIIMSETSILGFATIVHSICLFLAFVFLIDGAPLVALALVLVQLFSIIFLLVKLLPRPKEYKHTAPPQRR
jgi:hypothetical protein